MFRICIFNLKIQVEIRCTKHVALSNHNLRLFKIIIVFLIAINFVTA
jgi:hypothetical protein